MGEFPSGQRGRTVKIIYSMEVIMDSKQKGNLAVAIIPFNKIAGQTTINIGRESKWSKWEQYQLPCNSGNCSPIEESIGENSSNSVKPL